LVKRSKTPPFHGGYTGSNPVRVTKQNTRVISSVGRAPALQAGCRQFEPVIAHQNKDWPRGVVVNMPACHAGDRRFKSDRGRHIIYASNLKWVGGRVVKGDRL
jgi:hypothetical protein